MTGVSDPRAGISVVSLDGLPSVVIRSPKALGANGRVLSRAIMDAIADTIPGAVHPNAVRS